ncbi:MAG TPA: hypothetical protein VLH77_04555, partial [Gammaproteobacteria bacterium]|nr:hypothetical protein [Gammaproteobacteria bacterium]
MKKLSMGLVIVIYCFAGFLQAQLFLNWDVNWLMLAAQRLLQGGNYAQNFFETNPPLILYLYMPPLWASKFFSISQGMALCLYVFFAASISLSGCYLLLQRIFLDEKNSVFLTLFFTTLTAVFLLVPLYEFGQRDHLVLIFTLPYLLLVSLRLQNQALRADRACLIGVLAGVGFCIKPQTLFVPLLIELYYSCHKKNVLAWFRVEIVMMLSFAFFYLAALFYFFPDYLYFMVPFASRYYYYASMTWRTLLLFNPFLFCLLPFLFCLITPVHKAYVQLNRVLLLALLGFLGSYLAQRHIYYYHLVPAFSLALFLLVLYVGGWAAQDRWGRRDYWRALVLSALVSACLYWRARAIWVALIFTPFAFFSYFA